MKNLKLTLHYSIASALNIPHGIFEGRYDLLSVRNKKYRDVFFVQVNPDTHNDI